LFLLALRLAYTAGYESDKVHV